jgi:hypothetical protein
MYIGNDLIEAIPLELERISKPGYVGQFKRALKNKYSNLIQEQNKKLDFLVVATKKEEQIKESSFKILQNKN